MISQSNFGAALCVALLSFTSSCRSSNPVVPRRAESADILSPQSKSMEPASQAGPSNQAGDSNAPEVIVKTVEPAVARIDGEQIRVGELLAAWMHADSQGVRNMLERIVSARIVGSEARRLGITVDQQLVAEGFTLAVMETERDLQLKYPGITLDQWVADGLGLDPATYRARLFEDVHRRLLAERIVRVFIYARIWADARVIVVEKREEADAILERLAAGEPFARLANELSLDPTGRSGGRVPPIIKNDSAISRLAFSLEPGAVGGPILEAERWMVLILDELNPPLVGTWAEIEGEIEGSLISQPIQDPEYWLWKVEMTQQHPVDFEPLLDLIGDSAP